MWRRSRHHLCAVAAAQNLLAFGNVAGALKMLDDAKATTSPIQDVDFLRAQALLVQGDAAGARQALLEELRHFPAHREARAMLAHVQDALRPFLDLPADVAASEPEFAMCYDGIRDHTMLTWPRLLQLYRGVHETVKAGVEGDFVECGVAGGGSVVLIALAIRFAESAKDSRPQPRRVFACDTFSGMPPPTTADRLLNSPDGASNHTPADAASTHWSTGTCSGGAAHLGRLATSFGVEVTPVAGLFDRTLAALPTTQVAGLHVDADWHESVRTALSATYPKVPRGGYVQLDDYGYWAGCRTAVDAYLDPAAKASLKSIDGNAVWLRKG